MRVTNGRLLVLNGAMYNLSIDHDTSNVVGSRSVNYGRYEIPREIKIWRSQVEKDDVRFLSDS